MACNSRADQGGPGWGGLGCHIIVTKRCNVVTTGKSYLPARQIFDVVIPGSDLHNPLNYRSIPTKIARKTGLKSDFLCQN